MAEKDTKSETSSADHAKLQKAAADATIASKQETLQREQDAHYDSMLTVDAHVGKAHEEPHKDRAMEALKVDLEEVTGAQEVSSKPMETEGKGTTDMVTDKPEGARPGGGHVSPQTFLQRAGAVVGSGTEKNKDAAKRGGESRQEAREMVSGHKVASKKK